MKFDDETKKVSERNGEWLGFGVHEVTIGQVEQGFTEPSDGFPEGKEYMEFTLVGPNGEEETARLWFVSPANANISFNIIRQIYVHCAPEDKKTEAANEFDATNDTTEVIDLLQKCYGRKIWLSKYPDATRTYTAQDGSVKKSINKNIYGYQPKERPDLLPKDGQKEALNDLTKGATPEASSNIPASDGWATPGTK